jgi:mRNA-degrading endonuclease RelE of RelBE toxin-antitoxin system
MRRNIVATDKFSEMMDDLRRGNRQLADRIDQEIIDLSNDPYHNTKVYHDPKAPLRLARIGRTRLFYQYCRDCRLRGVDDKVGCLDCNDTADETIKLFDFDDRDKGYRKMRRKTRG